MTFKARSTFWIDSRHTKKKLSLKMNCSIFSGKGCPSKYFSCRFSLCTCLHPDLRHISSWWNQWAVLKDSAEASILRFLRKICKILLVSIFSCKGKYFFFCHFIWNSSIFRILCWSWWLYILMQFYVLLCWFTFKTCVIWDHFSLIRLIAGSFLCHNSHLMWNASFSFVSALQNYNL